MKTKQQEPTVLIRRALDGSKCVSVVVPDGMTDDELLANLKVAIRKVESEKAR